MLADVRRTAHLLVAGHMQVRATQAAIAEQGVHVGVAGDEPVIDGLVVVDRRVAAEHRIRGVRVGDEPGSMGRKSGVVSMGEP